MNTLLRNNIRSYGRRYLATGTAVAIAAMFVFVALAFSSALHQSLTKQIRSTYHNVDVVATVNDDIIEAAHSGDESQPHPQTIAEAERFLQQQPDVAAVYRETFSSAFIRTSGNSLQDTRYLPPEPFTQPTLVQGQWPQRDDEIVVADDYLNAWQLQLGDRIFFEPLTSAYEVPPLQLQITGSYKAVKGRVNGPYISRELYERIYGDEDTKSLFIAFNDSDSSVARQQQLLEQLTDTLSTNTDPGAQALEHAFTLATGDAMMQEDLQRVQSQQAAASMMFLVFPLITAFVAIIVIASSFQVLLQQRRRELALLRSLGATKKQVRRLLLFEAGVLGGVAGAIGIALASVIAVVGLWATGYAASFAEAVAAINPLSVIAVLSGAIVVTMLVGTKPAAGFSKVSPMEALARAQVDPDPDESHGKNVIVGGVLIAVGMAAAFTALSVLRGENIGFLLAVLGGLLSLLGVLMVASTTLWRVTSALGNLGKGVVAQLATANTRRNPQRTAATGTASIIGITLIVLLSVGAASTKATLLAEIDYKRSYDLVVEDSSRPLRDDVARNIQAIDGIAAAVAAASGAVDVTADTGEEATHMMIVHAPNLGDAMHAPLPVPGENEVIVADTFSDGQQLHICADGDGQQCRDLTAKVFPPLGSAIMYMSESNAKALVPDAEPTRIFIKLDPGMRADKAGVAIQEIVPSASVSGSAQERATYIEMIDQAFAVVAILVAVSVLVALVGLANTLSLSVLERIHENGLLRALGLTRKQMQKTLMVEALLINSAGLLVGVVLGVLYGMLGTYALPLEVHSHQIALPWGIIGAVVAVSTLAAMLASIVPGRKASKVSPSEALVAE